MHSGLGLWEKAVVKGLRYRLEFKVRRLRCRVCSRQLLFERIDVTTLRNLVSFIAGCVQLFLAVQIIELGSFGAERGSLCDQVFDFLAWSWLHLLIICGFDIQIQFCYWGMYIL